MKNIWYQPNKLFYTKSYPLTRQIGSINKFNTDTFINNWNPVGTYWNIPYCRILTLMCTICHTAFRIPLLVYLFLSIENIGSEMSVRQWPIKQRNYLLLGFQIDSMWIDDPWFLSLSRSDRRSHMITYDDFVYNHDGWSSVWYYIWLPLISIQFPAYLAL